MVVQVAEVFLGLLGVSLGVYAVVRVRALGESLEQAHGSLEVIARMLLRRGRGRVNEGSTPPPSR